MELHIFDPAGRCMDKRSVFQDPDCQVATVQRVETFTFDLMPGYHIDCLAMKVYPASKTHVLRVLHIYIYIYTYIHIYIHKYIYICNLCIHIYMHVYSVIYSKSRFRALMF